MQASLTPVLHKWNVLDEFLKIPKPSVSVLVLPTSNSHRFVEFTFIDLDVCGLAIAFRFGLTKAIVVASTWVTIRAELSCPSPIPLLDMCSGNVTLK